ncbi:MAG: hypothetical protein ACI92G_001259 [Candidatus Pelagisphaera sp.]|jgi:hypothetical protein
MSIESLCKYYVSKISYYFDMFPCRVDLLNISLAGGIGQVVSQRWLLRSLSRRFLAWQGGKYGRSQIGQNDIRR